MLQSGRSSMDAWINSHLWIEQFTALFPSVKELFEDKGAADSALLPSLADSMGGTDFKFKFLSIGSNSEHYYIIF